MIKQPGQYQKSNASLTRNPPHPPQTALDLKHIHVALDILAALAPEVVVQEDGAVVEELEQLPPLAPLGPLGELALWPSLVRV